MLHPKYFEALIACPCTFNLYNETTFFAGSSKLCTKYWLTHSPIYERIAIPNEFNYPNKERVNELYHGDRCPSSQLFAPSVRQTFTTPFPPREPLTIRFDYAGKPLQRARSQPRQTFPDPHILSLTCARKRPRPPRRHNGRLRRAWRDPPSH